MKMRSADRIMTAETVTLREGDRTPQRRAAIDHDRRAAAMRVRTLPPLING
jgi:hypothetical protein